MVFKMHVDMDNDVTFTFACCHMVTYVHAMWCTRDTHMACVISVKHSFKGISEPC